MYQLITKGEDVMERIGKLVEEYLVKEDGNLYLIKFYRKNEDDMMLAKLKIKIGDASNGHLESPSFEYSSGAHFSGGVDENQIK